MERNNRKEGTHDEEEVCSLSDMIYTICSENHHELNPLQEIFGSQPSSKPKVVTKNSDLEKHDEESNRMAKKQRSMDYRVMMEKVKMIFYSSFTCFPS